VDRGGEQLPPPQQRLRPEPIGEDQKRVPYGTFFCTHLPGENFLVNGLARVNKTAIRPHGSRNRTASVEREKKPALNPRAKSFPPAAADA